MKRGLGFTLIEICVAISVSLLLVALLTQSIALLRNGWRNSAKASTEIEQKAVAMRFLFDTIANAIPPDREAGHEFMGGNDRLSFLTTPPQALSFLGPLRVSLQAEPSPEGLQLVASIVPLHYRGATLLDAEKKILLRNIDGVEFSYIDNLADAEKSKTFWNSASRLPNSIRIRISHADRTVSPIVTLISPRRSASGACSFDFVTAGCR